MKEEEAVKRLESIIQLLESALSQLKRFQQILSADLAREEARNLKKQET